MKKLIRTYKIEIFLIWIIIGILSGFLTGKVCQLADPKYFTSTYEKKNLLEIIGYGITSNPKIFLMLFVSGGIGATYFYLSSKWWFYAIMGLEFIMIFQVSPNQAGHYSAYGAYYYVHTGEAYNFHQCSLVGY